jgi:hypothetical protein
MDQDLSGGLLDGRVVGAFGEFAVLELLSGATSATRCGALMARQRDWAASISLNAMAIPAAREPA